MMDQTGINDVSDTALWVATYRATESARPDALFQDPLAKVLAGERGAKIAEAMNRSAPQTGWAVVIRTCIIDDLIQKLITEGIDTVVNLGAGLDTRPYRLNLPTTLRWIEVDYPHMIELKDTKLARELPKCKLERVKLDLADRVERQVLFTRINSQSKKILILTEGVTPYLTEEQVATLADDLRAQDNFCFWITDYFAPQLQRYLQSNKKRVAQMKNAPFVFFPKDWFGFFALHGWKPREERYLAEESEKLGRPIPMPRWAGILHFFIRSKRALAFKKFTAYILLETK
jgi:methyltransferase (TIGR00027 family)